MLRTSALLHIEDENQKSFSAYKRFRDSLVSNSVSDNYEEAAREWTDIIFGFNTDTFKTNRHDELYSNYKTYREYYDRYKEYRYVGNCICNVNIKHINLIKNKLNGNIVVVGSTCIKRFRSDILNKQYEDIETYVKNLVLFDRMLYTTFELGMSFVSKTKVEQVLNFFEIELSDDERDMLLNYDNQNMKYAKTWHWGIPFGNTDCMYSPNDDFEIIYNYWDRKGKANEKKISYIIDKRIDFDSAMIELHEKLKSILAEKLNNFKFISFFEPNRELSDRDKARLKFYFDSNKKRTTNIL